MVQGEQGKAFLRMCVYCTKAESEIERSILLHLSFLKFESQMMNS